MIIYPEIAIKNGRCVTLRKGQMTLPEEHDTSPLDLARHYEAHGAEWLHVADLDATGRHSHDNTALVEQIIREVDIPVQVSGGIHKPHHIDWWIDRGAETVVIGSAAYLGPGVVRSSAERHPFRVLVSVDIRDGEVMVDGWTRPTGTPPLDFLQSFDNLCLAGVIVNDTDYDADLPDGSVALVADLARQLKTPVIASGLAKTLDHVSTLKYLGTIAGAIVGRGLHHGTFTLEEAQRIVVERDTRAMMLRRLSEGAPVKKSGITIHQGPPSEKGTSRPRGARFAKVAESHS
ncbi:1-(5-phosphoribosyl)-5-[(5-phosphoribosylamino)methylideneamino]imidazole-4-carboxamide isomerase [Roseovarius indicus]|uniref:1-(5-phosphoribosyl)-5-[(5- phosphoribosylamino)methylideneamino]imidazole-4- carboxamide isomerase n=1 Tax=Roseovarius indicus TaxID=540747 RepID=UPI0007DA4837|nr:1-(5-phosphoribosyl)-5-[(5-phosphoribosylamino)methylideneamino] imidazole-4-carboxamide isomerase [Roseovarius indicus]OAO10483.1 hypothetical protein A8B76_10430 [Roseovarius indicus]